MPLGIPRNFLTGPDRSFRMMPRGRFGLPSWAMAVLAVTVFGCWFPLFGEPLPLIDSDQKSGEKVGEFLDETSLDLLLKGSAKAAPGEEPQTPPAGESMPDELTRMVDVVAPGDLDESVSFSESEEAAGGETSESTMEILTEAGFSPDFELTDQDAVEVSKSSQEAELQE